MKKRALTVTLAAGMMATSIFGLSACDQMKGLLDKMQDQYHDHVVQLVEAVDPTCETDGNKAYYKCDCGRFFLYENPALQIKENSWVVPAIGHDYQPAEYYDSENKYLKKSVCSRDEEHILDNQAITVTPEEIDGVINSEGIWETNSWRTYKLNLDGEYAKMSIKAFQLTGEGSGEMQDPCIAKRVVNDFVVDGNSTAKVAGFKLGAHFNTVYVEGGHYYREDYLEIGTLTLKNLTLTDVFYIDGNVKIQNLILDNVTFDFTDTTISGTSAFRVISEDCVVENLTIQNSNFEKAVGCQYAIMYDTRTADDVRIIIENCVFADLSYNAIQLSGSGSTYSGCIRIKNNKITNTADRAIRISNLSDISVLEILGNVMVNASDDDGELVKVSSIPAGAAVTVHGNYWGAKEDCTAVQGVVDGDGDALVADTAPLESAE